MSAASFVARANVSRETLERLEIYASLLKKWNPKINLVAKSTIPDLWDRHFLDSAQIFDLAPQGTHWVDLGTGGGFPGIVVTIMAMEKRPGLRFTCVESDQRKATFLRAVLRETGAKAEVIAKRIEDIEPLLADILSARALAPLGTLLTFAERHLAPGGTCLFSKGAEHAKEQKEALETWAFRADTYPSITNPDAVVLKIGDISRG